MLIALVRNAAVKPVLTAALASGGITLSSALIIVFAITGIACVLLAEFVSLLEFEASV